MEENRLYAGYAEAVVTPPMGVHVYGYYKSRISDGIITDLHIRAAAFACGEKRSIFFTVEAINMNANAGDILRPMIAERCGIPVEAVYISCNHSHTAFRIIKPSGKNERYDIFLLRLFQQFCDAAQFAFEDLKPVSSLKTVVRDAPGVCFKRRYYMKDGTVKTNPAPSLADQIVGPVGKTDDSVRLVRVVREGGKELLMVCFGMHADNVGGTRYCADYTGYMTSALKGAFGKNAEVLFFNGAEGDSVTRSRQPGVGPQLPHGSGLTLLAQRAGRCLAGAVLEMYDDAKDVASDSIDYQTVTIEVGKNPYDPEYVPTARMIRDLYLKYQDRSVPELKGYNVPEAMRIMANLERPEFFHLNLSFMRIGDIAFAGIPGEPFQDIGVAVKAKSPFENTVFTSCTNGAEGYYPTREAFEAGGYERSASPFAWDVAEKIEEGALRGLNEMYERREAE